MKLMMWSSSSNEFDMDRKAQQLDVTDLDSKKRVKDLLSHCEMKVVWWLNDLSKNFEHLPNQQRQVFSCYELIQIISIVFISNVQSIAYFFFRYNYLFLTAKMYGCVFVKKLLRVNMCPLLCL